jgi:hypothetical protein
LAWVFVLCVGLQLFYFFIHRLCVQQKNKCAAKCVGTKTMTIKLPATPNTALSFGGVSRAVALALFNQ